MSRIITAVSVIALMGAGAIATVRAGGPPDGGYPTQTQTQMNGQTNGVQGRARQPGVMVESRSERIAPPRVTYFHGLKVVYVFPDSSIDSNGVQPGHIGAEPRASRGTLVSEILGTGTPMVASRPGAEAAD